MRLPCAVVLLAVDLPAHAVLAAIDVLPLLLRQLAAVGCAVRCDAAIDVLFAALRTRRFAGCHLAATDALRYAILLVLTALANLIVAKVGLRSVVFVLVDAAAQVVLAAIDILPLLLRELAAIGGAVRVNLLVQVGFARFEILGFACRQLT